MKYPLHALRLVLALLFFAVAPLLSADSAAAMTRIMGAITQVGADDSVTIDGVTYKPAPVRALMNAELPALKAGVTVTLYAVPNEKDGGFFYTDIALGLGTLPDIEEQVNDKTSDNAPQ